MANINTHYNQDTLLRIVCTFVFVLFAFFYLYFFQADLLTVMQHVLSKGQTHYNAFIGAVLITLVLLLIQLCVVNLCRRACVAWSVTFVPSALFLVALTDVHISPESKLLQFGGWIYLLPVGLASFALLVWAGHITEISVSMSRIIRNGMCRLWVNLLVMLAIVISVCSFGNNDKVYHDRVYVERCIIDGDYDKALSVLRRNVVADENLTMLTVYALSHSGGLPEHLFEFQLKGGSKAMMPNGVDTKFEMLPDSMFYSYLGGWYVQRMSTLRYFDYQRRHKRLNVAATDYLLCAYLMDKNLDAFVRDVSKHYTINDSVPMPKHYKEALLMYTHLHANPSIVYGNNVMNADYQDFQNMEKKYSDPLERQTALRDTYGNTYWYYYFYGNGNTR